MKARVTPSPVRPVSAAVIFLVLLIGQGTTPVLASLETEPMLWTQVARLTAGDAADDGSNGNPSHFLATFGSAVAVDGDTIVVGTAFDPTDYLTWAYVFERSAQAWVQVAKLVPPDAQEFAGFASYVAVDDQAGVIAIGDPGWDREGGERNSGAVYVYRRSEHGQWNLEQKLLYPGLDAVSDRIGAGFGTRVAVDGDTLAVGAPSAGADKHLAGEVYIYEHGANGWTYEASFEGAEREQLGWVALRRDTLVAGAIWEESDAGPSSGAVHVYERTQESWVEVATLTPPAPLIGVDGSAFGFAVDVSADGRTIVVGAPWNDEVLGAVNVGPALEAANFGAAYVFRRGDAGWALHDVLPNPDPQQFENFGFAVGVSPDATVVAISSQKNGGDQVRMGAVYVYKELAGSYRPVMQLRGNDTSPGDYFGEALSVSADAIVIGAPFDDNRRDGAPFPLDDIGHLPGVLPLDGAAAGSAYVFEQPLWVGSPAS